MTKYELWLKGCTTCIDCKCDVILLERFNDLSMYKIVEYNRKGNHYENNYDFMRVTYHVWNTKTSEGYSGTDYRTAYQHYVNMKGGGELCLLLQ